MKRRSKNFEFHFTMILYDLFKTILVFLIATTFALCLQEADVMNDNIFGVYMLAVAITSSITSGYFWGIVASFCGVVGVNFFFTFPYFALNFTLAGYPVTFGILLLMSILTSALTAKVKQAAILSSIREKRAESLNSMSKALLSANNIDEIMQITIDSVYAANQCSAVLYIGSPISPEKKVTKYVNEKDELILESILEQQVAEQAFQKGEMTGLGTEKTSQNCLGTYIPFSNKDRIYGVLGLLFSKNGYIENDALQFANFMTSQTILAIDRQEIVDESQKILLEKEKENMRSNLLRAISHDLRTPLTCILGSTATLMENRSMLQEDVCDRLLSDIHHDAEWLIQMVENLLSVTKISSEGTKLKKQDEVVEEIVAESVAKIQKRFPSSQIRVRVPDELLLVPMDAMLIEQVLINLMENAIRHSGTGKPIYLTVKHLWHHVYFSVLDQGIGIEEERLPHIFDGTTSSKSSDSSRGLGIGLPICKTIISAHGGEIYAKNNENGGANFTFVLPMKGEVENVQQTEDTGCRG